MRTACPVAQKSRDTAPGCPRDFPTHGRPMVEDGENQKIELTRSGYVILSGTLLILLVPGIMTLNDDSDSF